MLHELLPSVLALAFLAFPVRGQSFNVDFEPVTSPYGLPSASHGGAANSPGTWNSVSTSLPINLVGLDGGATSAVIDCLSTVPGFNHFDFPFNAGDAQALFDDFWGAIGSTAPIHWAFSNLAPGEYEVYTICCSPSVGGGLFVQVPGSPDGTRFVQAATASEYAEGESFTRHRKTVADGTLEVIVNTGGAGPNDSVINGLQILRLEAAVGLPMCFGDGTGANCPCSNAGDPARGCENSAATGGALLEAMGTTSPDTVVLRSSYELPTALSIFLQGNASIPPVLYGDGLRCAGGTLRRLYTKTASSGIVWAPGPGDPSITLRSAQLGVPIPPGGRRDYQVYYRDANPGFCPAPQGSTFNVSSAVKIDW